MSRPNGPGRLIFGFLSRVAKLCPDRAPDNEPPTELTNMRILLVMAGLMLAASCTSTRVCPNSITFHNNAYELELRERHNIASERFEVTGGVFGAYKAAEIHVVFQDQEMLYEVRNIGLQTWVFVNASIDENQFQEIIAQL